MKAHEFNIEAEKIASNYVGERGDLNEKVAQVAVSKKMNAEQTKRLIEETNKKTLLTLFEKTGEQSFPLADFDKIKLITKPIEKVAFKAQEPMPFSDYFQEKTASEQERQPLYSGEFVDLFNETMTKTAEYSARYEQQVDLYSQIKKTYGLGLENGPLFKAASLNEDARVSEFKMKAELLEKTASEMATFVGSLLDSPEYAIFCENIDAGNFIEKNAGFVKELVNGAINPFDKATVKAGAGAVAGKIVGFLPNAAGKLGAGIIGGTAKGIGKVVPFVAKGALKTGEGILGTLGGPGLLGLGMGAMQLGAIKMEAGKIGQALSHSTGANFIGSAVPGGKIAAESLLKAAHEQKYSFAQNLLKVASQYVPYGDTMEKNADWHMGLQHLLDFVAPVATAGWGGIATTAAKKLGGGIALTMNSRQLQKSFDTIMQRNPEFKEKESAIKEYFHVIADNAPSLAKNPMVAEGIVKNFDALGTVDFNTIGAMRKTESEGRGSHGDDINPLRF